MSCGHEINMRFLYLLISLCKKNCKQQTEWMINSVCFDWIKLRKKIRSEKKSIFNFCVECIFRTWSLQSHCEKFEKCFFVYGTQCLKSEKSAFPFWQMGGWNFGKMMHSWVHYFAKSSASYLSVRVKKLKISKLDGAKSTLHKNFSDHRPH